MRKIMICVAPVSAKEHDINPLAIAEDVYASYLEGAAIVHLHVRDIWGRLTDDLSVLETTVREIKKRCDIIIEISTGGVSDLTIKQRVAPCRPGWVDMNSLNIGSVNLGEAVYQNSPADVRYCLQEIRKNRKIPDTELFEVGMAATLRGLSDCYGMPKPMLVSLVVGHPGEMPATEAGLNHLIQGMYDNFKEGEFIWNFTQAYRKDWKLLEKALKLGAGGIRIGFEDSDYLRPDTRVNSNAPLVAKVAKIIRNQGMDIMGIQECRHILGITG